MPDSLLRYHYRKEFHLTAAEFEEEPIDQFFTNLSISALIKEKEQKIAEHNNRG